MIWLQLCTSYIAAIATTTSIILSATESRMETFWYQLTHDHPIKWPLKHTVKLAVKLHCSTMIFHKVVYSSSSSSDRVDSRGPLRQPRVATTTSLGPFSTNAEGCTIAGDCSILVYGNSIEECDSFNSHFLHGSFNHILLPWETDEQISSKQRVWTPRHRQWHPSNNITQHFYNIQWKKHSERHKHCTLAERSQKFSPRRRPPSRRRRTAKI